MTTVGPLFLASILQETFEDFEDDAMAQEAGELLAAALARHGHRLTLTTDEEIPDDIKALNPYRGTDLWRLVRGLVLKDELDKHLYPAPGSIEWLLPPDVLPGVTQAWGLTVRHIEGLPGPYLAHRVEEA